MTQDEERRFLRDKNLWEKKIAEKEAEARKVRETISKAGQGAGGMYGQPVPYFPNEPTRKGRGK
jgi:hypothetical protein